MQDFYKKLNDYRKTSNQVSNLKKLKTNPISPKLSKQYIQSLRKNLQSFSKYVRKIYDENHGISNTEVKESIEKILNDLNFQYANSSSFRSNSIRVDICNYFKNHPIEFKNLYRQMIAEEKETGIPIKSPEIVSYSSNQEQSKRQLLEQLITSYRNIKSSFGKSEADFLNKYARSSTKFKRTLREIQPNVETVNFIVKNEMFFMDEESGLKEFFKEQCDFLSHHLREDYIESLKNISAQLSEFNLLERYVKRHNTQILEIGFPELSFSEEEVYSMNSSFSNGDLSHLSLGELSSLNAFWINRLTKEIINFNTAFFIISDLDLWSEIRKAPLKTVPNIEKDSNTEDTFINVPITDEQIEALDEKMKFLYNETTYYYYKFLNNLNISELSTNENEDSAEGKINNSGTSVQKNLFEEISDLHEQIGSDYYNYFSTVNNGALKESNNDFFDDFNSYHISANITCNSYSIKSNIMLAQLSMLFNNSAFSKNWGLSFEKGKTPNKSDKVIIAIDIPGFNMPFRLHIERDLLEDFLRANQNTTKIPLYQGENDFFKKVTRKKHLITTPLLMPISKEYKKKLKELSSSIPETNRYYKFIKHLEFISDGVSCPDHLKSKSKKGSVKKKFLKRSYDFSDGKVYIIHKNNTFIEDKDYLGGSNEHTI